MNGVAIRYGDVAPEAKENFLPETEDKATFVNLEQLRQYNLLFPNYANPCELYSVVLDGTATAFPSAPETANLGLWSEQVSGEDGAFETPIELTLTAEGQYSSQGLTLTFDIYNGIFANYINIKWYRDLEIIADMDFNPDSAFYFCRNQVENYNKVKITFYSVNMPYNRLKLRVIDYGYGTYFYGNELRNVKLIQEINPISSEISINTCDFTLDSKTDMEYSFQAKQPLSVYFNGELKATTFVKTSKRTAKRLWTVQGEDYIGLLDSIPFMGGIYTNKSAVELLNEIFTLAKVPFSVAEVFADSTVSGYIQICTCREALMQVAFAIGAVVDTSNSDVVKIYALSDEVTQTIPLKRIMQGQSFEDEETVTGVEIAVHTYEAKEQIDDSRVLAYNASENGTGQSIFVKFDEPLRGLYTVNDGEIVSSGSNYAIVNANNTSFRLIGYGYEHTTQTKRKNNPTILASEVEKIVAVENATLVSANNADMLLDKCYEWLVINKQVNLKIIEGKHITGGETVKYGTVKYGTVKYGQKSKKIVTYDMPVNVGEVIASETEYLGDVTGRVIKETFSLNGGIIIKEAVLR